MRNIFILILFILPLSSFSQSELLDYVKENHEDVSDYYIYGSVLRSVVSIMANEESVDAIKYIHRVGYFTVEDSANYRKNFADFTQKSKEFGLEEYISVQGAAIKSLPDLFQKIGGTADELTVLIKDNGSKIENLTILILTGAKITIISTEGSFELKEILKIKAKEDAEMDDLLKIIPNLIF